MTTPYHFENPERHAIAMRELSETLTFVADDGQRFSGVHVNRDFTSSALFARLNAMFCSVVGPEQRYAAYQYAVTQPESPVVVIDMPSHGNSDNLTDAQRKEILSSGSMQQIGAAHAQALRRHLPEITDLVAVGDSLGARSAVDLAQEAGKLDIEPQAVIGFEMAGIEERFSIAVAASYFVSEFVKTRLIYKDNPAFALLDRAYEEEFQKELAETGYKEANDMIGVFRNDPKFLKFIFTNLPLANDAGIDSIDRLLGTYQNTQLALVVGGLSSICRWNKLKPVFESIKKHHPNRVKVDIWPDDSHGMSLAPQQPRMAEYTKELLTGTV